MWRKHFIQFVMKIFFRRKKIFFKWRKIIQMFFMLICFEIVKFIQIAFVLIEFVLIRFMQLIRMSCFCKKKIDVLTWILFRFRKLIRVVFSKSFSFFDFNRLFELREWCAVFHRLKTTIFFNCLLHQRSNVFNNENSSILFWKKANIVIFSVESMAFWIRPLNVLICVIFFERIKLIFFFKKRRWLFFEKKK